MSLSRNESDDFKEFAMHLPQYFSPEQQIELLQIARQVAKHSPLFTPTMKNGAAFRYQNTSCGEQGWISDRLGYRYSKLHPNGKPWYPMPDRIRDLAMELAALAGEIDYKPQTCLINYYKGNGKLGLHQDNSESNLEPCLISISLGDTATFLLGGCKQSDPIKEIELKSGDCLILASEQRLAFHGIKQVIPGTSNLLKNGGRLNLTIRQIF